MLTRTLLFRIAGPTLLVSLLFLGSCITAAIYLHHRQSASVQVLDESITSRRIVGDLLKMLDDLAKVPGNRRDEAEALQGRICGLLARAEQAADKPGEGRLVSRLEEGFGRYLRRWGADGGLAPISELAGHEALRILEEEVVPVCRELEQFNAAEIERAEAPLHRTVTWMAWGLVGVGAVGSLAGLLLGYGVARGLGRAVLRAEALTSSFPKILQLDRPGP